MSSSDTPSSADKKTEAFNKKKAKLALRKKIQTIDATIDENLAKTRYAKDKAKRKQQRQKMLLWAGGAIVLGLLLYVIFAKGKASIEYGLCKVFIETRVEYPRELRFTAVQTYPSKIRVWYVAHDSFGQKPIEKMDCSFTRVNGIPQMTKAEINRGEIDPRDIELFNYSIPAILENPPDLEYPRGLPGDLKLYRR